MDVGKTLISRAIENGYSVYRLHKMTGVSEGNLYEMRDGKRAVTPALAGQLAELLGDDPREAALSAVVSQAKPERQSALQKLFKLAPTAAAALVVITLGAPSPSAAAAQNAACTNSGQGLYIM